MHAAKFGVIFARDATPADKTHCGPHAEDSCSRGLTARSLMHGIGLKPHHASLITTHAFCGALNALFHIDDSSLSSQNSVSQNGGGLMKRFVFIAILITALTIALVPGAFAQTTNPKYDVTNFGGPFPTPTGKDRDTAAIAAAGKGLIFVLRRAEPPVLVYNREGKLVNSWGTGLFVDTHNIDVDRFGFVWI